MERQVLNKCVAFVEGWQMKCCGTPFRIGDTICWTVIKYGEDELPDQCFKPDFIYENHGNPQTMKLYKLDARVDSIKANYYKIEYLPIEENKEMTRGQHIGNYVFVDSFEVTEADGWDKDKDGSEFDSYIVQLSDCTIEPQIKQE